MNVIGKTKERKLCRLPNERRTPKNAWMKPSDRTNYGNGGRKRRKDRRRNSQIGELVTKYFPSLKSIEPGTTAEENRCVFEKLEAFLFTLSIRDDLIEEMQNSAEDLLRDDSEGNWRQA